MKHSHATKICTDFGEVELDREAVEAIQLVQDMAWTLQLTPGEFMSEFEDGIPTCPACKQGTH